jgi:hypothetical protein
MILGAGARVRTMVEVVEPVERDTDVDLSDEETYAVASESM